MKIKKLYEFIKINEMRYDESKLFVNEDNLKKLLMDKVDFSKGDVHQAIMDVIHDEWQKTKDGYEEILDWTEKNLGIIPYFAMQLGKFNYQVCNGGHAQYFDNGYASTGNSAYISKSANNIELHNIFELLFKDLDMVSILPHGQEAYKIISEFDAELSDEEEECSNCNGSGEEECYDCEGNGRIECPECNGEGEDDEGEKCSNCDGNGSVDCVECDGEGKKTCYDCDGDGYSNTGEKVPNTSKWEELDNRWYEINEEVMEGFNEYLKTLTLDGQRMTDLIKKSRAKINYSL